MSAPRVRLAAVLAGLLGSLAFLVIAMAAQAQQPADAPVVARVTVKPPDLARFMALGLDLLEMREGGDLFVVTTAAEVDRLRADGWRISVDTEQTSRLQQQQRERQQQRAPSQVQPLFMGGYRTVAEARAFVEDEAARYPDLAEVDRKSGV